jgi:Zn-finger nucleic acid-binding protein
VQAVNCENCGAALPPRKRICAYCGALNEVDLRRVSSQQTVSEASGRRCPSCSFDLQTQALGDLGGMQVECCPSCHGLFFDPGEVEDLLRQGVVPAEDVDFRRLRDLVELEAIPVEGRPPYVPCPQCGRKMNRKNDGARSGVVVDRCAEHGVWLDGGELRQLVEWTRAGGQAHAEQRQAQDERAGQRRVCAAVHHPPAVLSVAPLESPASGP